uniref:Uncharacterized protein n=1 Tax=Salarias fasciatus TaxID=181472 RepID=A0A672G9M1_SALFA
MKNPFTAGFPQPALPGAYSVELPFSSYGLIKYSIPQPPGRQSVEVYYPYDFSQQRVNIPDFGLKFNPTFDINTLPSQDPLAPLQDQPIQTSQVHSNLHLPRIRILKSNSQ